MCHFCASIIQLSLLTLPQRVPPYMHTIDYVDVAILCYGCSNKQIHVLIVPQSHDVYTFGGLSLQMVYFKPSLHAKLGLGKNPNDFEEHFPLKRSLP